MSRYFVPILSVELGEILTISTSAAGSRLATSEARFAVTDTAPAPGISPGEHSVAVTVHVSFAIR